MHLFRQTKKRPVQTTGNGLDRPLFMGAVRFAYEIITLTPGPIDEQMEIFFKYDPLAATGFDFLTVSRSA